MKGLSERNEMRKESLQTHVTVIPKEGKDATLCSSYRPITLLNEDTKLNAKVLATRLKVFKERKVKTMV